MRKKDIYETWVSNGLWNEVSAFIKDCTRKMVSQREMCIHLHMEESTFSRLKKRHPEIQAVIDEAKLDLKKDLINALYKKAIGFETVDEEQFIEDKGKGQEQKRKIHRTKKQVGPDYKSIVYLLTKVFGKEYSERYEELKLMEQKMIDAKEEWNNGNEEVECGSDENIGD